MLEAHSVVKSETVWNGPPKIAVITLIPKTAIVCKDFVTKSD